MGLVRGGLGAAALAVAAAAGLAQINDVWRYEILTRAMYLPFRALTVSGHLFDVLGVDHDGSGTLIPRGGCPPWLWDEIKAWEPDGDDAVVATFPKSGTHFMMQLMLQAAANGSVDLTEPSAIHHYAAVPELVSRVNVDDDRMLTLANYRSLAPTRPRLVATHLAPHQMRVDSPAKFVVVIRDPIAVVGSMHAQIQKMLGPRLAPSLVELYHNMFKRVYGGWAEYNLAWWRLRERPNVVILFYEDLVREPEPGAREVIRLLGKDTSDAALLSSVIERSSFKYMKARADCFEPPQKSVLLPFKNPYARSDMVHGGKKEKPSAALARELRAYALGVFAGTDFPVERYFNDGE